MGRGGRWKPGAGVSFPGVGVLFHFLSPSREAASLPHCAASRSLTNTTGPPGHAVHQLQAFTLTPLICMCSGQTKRSRHPRGIGGTKANVSFCRPADLHGSGCIVCLRVLNNISGAAACRESSFWPWGEEAAAGRGDLVCSFFSSPLSLPPPFLKKSTFPAQIPSPLKAL